jgi:hypothetical protein
MDDKKQVKARVEARIDIFLLNLNLNLFKKQRR